MWVRALLVVVALAALGAKKPTRTERTAIAIEKVKAAVDPAVGPPILEAVYPKISKAYAHLGPPGPYYPDYAAREGSGGMAVIQCKVAASGRLNACVALAAAPPDMFFDAAALRMAEVGHLIAGLSAGAPEGRLARIVVIFPKPKW